MTVLARWETTGRRYRTGNGVGFTRSVGRVTSSWISPKATKHFQRGCPVRVLLVMVSREVALLASHSFFAPCVQTQVRSGVETILKTFSLHQTMLHLQ